MLTFSDLPFKIQYYINERFSEYGINGEAAFNSPNIFPDELKELSPDDLYTLLQKKHISHIMPKSQYPEFEDKVENIILEDAEPNLERGASIMTSEEKETAFRDLLEDIEDGDIDEDGIRDLGLYFDDADNLDMVEEIVGASLFGGMVYTGAEAYNKIKKKEISLDDVPHFFLYKTGGRTIKLAVIGTLLSSGSLIIVGGTTAYLIYRSRKLFQLVFNAVFSDKVSEKVIEIYNYLNDRIDEWVEKKDITSGMYSPELIPNEVKKASDDFKNRRKI